MILYLSHSAGRRDDPDWWIVEPRDEPVMLRQQVESLLNFNGRRRRVVQVVLWDCGGAQVTELTDLPEDFQSAALDEMKYREGRAF